ncbi:MAG: hypothetical protein QM765_03445 [Myxococcales bacterium]
MNSLNNIRRLALGALLVALPFASCECPREPLPQPKRVESFGLNVKQIKVYGTSGNEAFTEWSKDAPLPMPRVGALLEVEVWAKDKDGYFMPEFQNPVSFRSTPGNIVAVSEPIETITDALTAGTVDDLRKTNPRLLNCREGVCRGWVLIEKVFGETYLWAQDSPPAPVFALPTTEGDEPLPDAGEPDSGLPGLDAGPDTGWIEVDGGRTHVAGISAALWFAAPTVADMQLLPGKSISFFNKWCPQNSKPNWNNRISPFIGNFLTIDAPPPRGDMIVTAISVEGFYVADLLANPITDTFYTDDPTRNRTLPGTYGYMYVYNYNYPDGLFTGDRVLSLTGTVQEFSGSTQLVFPSWIRKEGYARPEDRPKPILLDFSDPQIDAATGKAIDDCVTKNPGTHCDNGKPPTNYSLRCVKGCGEGVCPAGTECVDDQYCACAKTDTTDTCTAAFPGTHCDTDSGLCAGTCPETPCPTGQWCVQFHCVDPANPCANTVCPAGEKCNPNTGACECGPSLGYRVSKTRQYSGTPAYQKVTQWMDVLFAYSNTNQEVESLESAIVKLSNVKPATNYVNCDSNGNSNIPPFRWASQADIHGCFIQGGSSEWLCDPNGDDTADCECNRDCITGGGAYSEEVCAEMNTFKTYGQWLVQAEDIWKTRINVSTRDAMPDFDPRIEFSKPEYKQCRVDITGVLRQVQAARPRWLILARDENDFCCRAPTGARCPTPDDVDAEGVAHPGKCPKCPSLDQ